MYKNAKKVEPGCSTVKIAHLEGALDVGHISEILISEHAQVKMS